MKSLRSKLFLLLALVLLLPVFGVIAQDATEEAADNIKWPDLGGREITIAVENAYPPYNYINDKNEAVGWDYDTFRDICKLLNCVPVFKQTSWDGMLIAVSKGEFDVAADGITYTADRAQTVDFSQLYQAYDETLLVRADESRFKNPDELKAISGFKVSTQVGTTNEITAKKLFGDTNVQSFDQFGAAVQALLNNDVDAVVMDRPAAKGYISNPDFANKLKDLPDSLAGVEGLAFAYPKGSSLVNPINAAMSALQASGRWDEVYKKWFSQQ